MTVRFSVCVSVSNDAGGLGDAIESVLGQEYTDWDLVIADNASEGDLASTVAAFDDGRIRYQRFTERVDQYEGVNQAFQLCNSAWIVPMNSGDRLDAGCLGAIAVCIGNAGTRRLAAVIARGTGSEASGVVPVADGPYDASQWFDLMSRPSQALTEIGAIALNRDALIESGWLRPDVGDGAWLELVLRVAAYGDVAYIDRKLMDRAAGGSLGMPNRADHALSNGSMTAVGAAWDSAVRAHAARRTIPPEQTEQIKAVIARSHIQRALDHRMSNGGGGRRGALRDVWSAYSARPSLLASPQAVGASTLALLAPKGVIGRVKM